MFADGLHSDLKEMERLLNPPQPVKHCLEAVLLLLGTPPYKCWDWPYVRKQLLRRSELVEKVLTFDPHKCDPSAAHAAKQVLKPYSAEKIASAAAASKGLFVWAQNAVEEVEACGGMAVQ